MNWSIAKKNFSRQGLRASLNVLVTALSIIALIFMLSLLNGFQAQATRNVINTDIGGGHYRAPGFDILSPSKWEDYTVKVPDTLLRLHNKDKAEVLVVQGQLYPNRRLYPVQIRGISMEQSLLQLPLDNLKTFSANFDDLIPVVVGAKMAKKAHLHKGDTLTLKWRDRSGAVDAKDIIIIDVGDILNPRVDEGVVWLRLDHLRLMTDRKNEVSWVAVKHYIGLISEFEFQPVEFLMSDLLALWRQDRMNSKILWAILMTLVCISVFNTQMLNIFKRQKEIGTLMALGMDSQRIVRIFTLEGCLAAIWALVVALLLGLPFFIWFQGVGFDVSHLSESTLPIRETIYPDYQPMEIIYSLIIVFILIVASSWFPVKKITRLDPTMALRGRAIK
ncbi:MAG: FtsX-like permease family protein [Nitrospina sp.]|jgi:putative ABC transport system permease protein|nr:FtsX-like permease family protein [Nitrospina sp.]MBT4127900.1 FtsX-like permease family protein [Nitrospina sp.]MBT6296128.1 FtsX-like permease family protein [Nitrospina sp.]MBT7521618.1 FtsX-like permease family protein [Nitrospina sp.]MDG1844185.1 FtsX-like permease family protein [Nitrospinaceae bacterium]|tara:strand:+ start:3461 stop:4630 length:1170 start_codon:yes stop_codon:yes gene_type:complete